MEYISNSEKETIEIAKQFDNLDTGDKISFTYAPVEGQTNSKVTSVKVK